MPNQAHALHARCVGLKSGGVMEWHSTHAREELLLIMNGRVVLEWQSAWSPPGKPWAPTPRSVGGDIPSGVEGSPRIARRALAAGQCAWIPVHTIHRVVNPFRRPATYVYVTGSVHPHSARRTPHANVHGSSSR